MIHYFNPGNEIAILNASKYYQPAANQVKMQKELAFLPAWYASGPDFVFLKESLPGKFITEISRLPITVKSISEEDFILKKKDLSSQIVELWGIAPNSIYLFEKMNQIYKLDLQIPSWKEDFIPLSSRETAFKILNKLIKVIPEINEEIIPHYFTTLNGLEDFITSQNKNLLLKSPFSSSGRGLIWLFPQKLPQSERQIIHGMLKKQKVVSVENKLDKQLDFSMHFYISESQIDFLGYSLFHANAKGSYQYSLLMSQERIKKEITNYIDYSLIENVKKSLSDILLKVYSPHYVGNIGVDMLIYKSDKGYELHPCVEINMRKSMGYLALQLYKNFIHPQSSGKFHIEFNSSPLTFQKDRKMKEEYPLIIENNYIRSGYMSLCPVTEETGYHAFIILEDKI